MKAWLVRAGSLVVVVGFFLPALSVSCTGLPLASLSLSMATLAGEQGLPLLYLVIVGMLAVLILSFIPATTHGMNLGLYFGQVGAVGLSIVSIFITVVYLSTQVSQYGFQVDPEIGILVIILGYVVTGVGLVLQIPEVFKHPIGRPAKEQDLYGYVDLFKSARDQPEEDLFSPGSPGALLQVIEGTLPRATIPIYGDRFSIGRGSDNDLQLPDSTVSRQHVHLRYAQGMWFLQDQGSTSRTFVNGSKVEAIRLNAGDELVIGDQKFIFQPG